MLLAHQIELKPNNKQATYFAKACGVSRFAYNWALDQWKQQYQAGEKPTEASLRRKLNGIKHKEFPWMAEVSKNAPQQAIKDLGSAFKRFFKLGSGYPKFKKKGIRDSFRADNGTDKNTINAVKVSDKRVKISKLGWIKMTEALRFKGQIKSLVVSRKADRWYASFTIETDQLPHDYDQIAVEDLNVKGMSANRKLARHILDQSFHEFNRQLTYKGDMYGSSIIKADRFFPSSKLCHVCGWKNSDLTLSMRNWQCLECNTNHDRDYNAAKNLESLCTVSSTETHACGAESAGLSELISETMPCRSKNTTSYIALAINS